MVERSRRSINRRLLVAMAAFPVIATILWSTGLALVPGAVMELSCWVLPNGRVLTTPADAECPLDARDQVLRVAPAEERSTAPARADSIVATIIRDGRTRELALPIQYTSRADRVARTAAASLVTGALLAIPLFVAWSSTSRAATPFAAFYSAVGVVVVTVMSGRHSEWLTRLALLAMVAAPGAMAHLSLTFPRERRLLREAPELAAVPYALSGLLVLTGAIALERNPLIWPTFMTVLLALTASGWLVLVLSCVFAIRESRSPLEKARARLLCFGALVLPVIPTLLLGGELGSAERAATAYLWTTAAVIPLPIGLAISRYNLFNLGWDIRRWMGRLVYLTAAALVVAIVLTGGGALIEGWPSIDDPATLVIASFACVAAIEPLRARLLGALESRIAPRLETLRRLRKEYEAEMAELRDEDAVARSLGDVLCRALASQAGAVFLFRRADVMLSYAFGEDPPAPADLVPLALAAVGEGGLRQLTRSPEDEDEAEGALTRAGVELVAAVDSGGERFGVLMLKGSNAGSPYSSVDLDFAAMAATHAAVALRNARTAGDLLEAERRAVTGRVAVALAHDLGKELDWVRRLVRRLPERLDDHMRLKRDVFMLQDFAEGLVLGLRQFVREATEARDEPRGSCRLGDAVDFAVRRVARIHGCDRVAQTVEPAARAARCSEPVGRAIANVLDNALHATVGDEPVRLFATLEDGWIRVAILDRGCGIPDGSVEDVFRPGFTTRGADGGLGIGLGVSRELIEALGGNLTLENDSEGGTRANIRVPIRR